MRFVVRGQSMEPTFREGQTLLVSSIPYLFRQPGIGDIVVVKDPRDGRLLLKRIVTFVPSRIRPREEYFVSGDNPSASTDSRIFGPITNKNILGILVKPWG